MASTTTPNMGLIVPGVGTEPGPTWASDLNASLGILDQHNHSSGQGVQIIPSGININADLPFNGNNAMLLKTINFSAQSMSLPGTAPNLGCVYVAGSELYYNDEAGNVVQITNNGSVNAGTGSITGLPSGTASASYSSGAQTFIWQSATSTPANMDFGSAILRNVTTSSNGLTLSPPNALGADYSLVFPLVPGSTSFVTLDNSGNFGTTLTTTLADSVATTMTTTGVNTIANERTRAVALNSDPGVGGVAISSPISYSGSGNANVNVPGLTVTLTTSGRPVYLGFQVSDANLTGALIIDGSGVTIEISRSPGPSVFLTFIDSPVAGSILVAPSTIWCIDTSPSGNPGTYTYQVSSFGGTVGAAYQYSNVVLIAYEL